MAEVKKTWSEFSRLVLDTDALCQYVGYEHGEKLQLEYMFSATDGLSSNMWLLSIEYEHKYNPTKCLLLNISGRLVTLYQQGAKP